jgi:predicted DNA-binding transcriptional regulator YafY
MPPAVRLRPEMIREKLALRASAFRPVREETWQAVSEALQKGVALSIRYRHPGGPAGEPRVVRPYALVLAGRDWMMLAEDRDPAQVKNFYLARIESAKLMTERYAIPKDFRADAFFRNTFGLFVGAGKPFRFRIRFSREVSDEIREMTWHPQQKIESEPSGGAVLELPAESLREAKKFILSYGRHAAAVAPPELVADLRAEVEAMAALYGSRGSRNKSASKTRSQA